MNKDYKELAVLASRLAESVLMDWDKEEQVKLAKEVATKCHEIFNDKESQEFVSLVKRMREAQKQWKDGDAFDGTEMELAKRMCESERKVDEYLKKMEM